MDTNIHFIHVLYTFLLLVKIMKSNILNLKNEFSKLKEETVDNMIKTMPPKQQEAIKMYFKA